MLNVISVRMVSCVLIHFMEYCGGFYWSQFNVSSLFLVTIDGTAVEVKIFWILILLMYFDSSYAFKIYNLFIIGLS